MISALVEDKLTREHISVRRAAKDMGLAHTTLGRVISGESIDLSTFITVSEWLGANPADLLRAEGSLGDASELAAALAVLIKSSPSLSKVFEEILTHLKEGRIGIETVRDLVAYAGYRLGTELSDEG